MEEKKRIRFIDSHYHTLFTIADGDSIEIIYPDGEREERVCTYIDEYHTQVGVRVFHICEFAEIMEANGKSYCPAESKEKEEREEAVKGGAENRNYPYGKEQALRIGIIDADLLYRKRHRFPNLACMKLSAYWKEQGFETELLLDYSQAGEYDRLYVSKVFTDTFVPDHILAKETTVYGGTGFFYDKAPVLPKEMEHHTPDYHLYDQMVKEHSEGEKKKKEFQFYTDYSIGFLTRGCFRKCSFCVNKNSTGAVAASPLEEFYDPSRKKLCFLDDNFFACAEWEKIFSSVLETGRRFQFRQGLDLRIMQKRQMELLASGKLDNGMIFAFDHIKDQELIVRKLELLREVIPVSYQKIKLYVLCGYDWEGTWKADFWAKDIRDVFIRIEILMRYKCLAYLMRYAAWERAPEIYKGMYINLSRWCNQPAQYSKKSLREFCIGQGEHSSSFRYLTAFETLHPEMAHYLDMKYEEVRYGKIYG